MTNVNIAKTNKYSYLLFGICFFCGLFGGLASTLMPAYLPDLVKDFATTDQEKVGAIINAAFVYGMLLGGIALGYISDKMGRKPGFILAVASMGAFMLLSAFAKVWTWLVFFRLMTGFGVGGILLVTAIMIAEEWTGPKRSIALGILSICFPVGIFSAGLITYAVSQWRSALLLGALPLLLTVIIYFFIHETKVWLNRQEVAATPAAATDNQGHVAANILKGSLIYGTMLIGLWAVFAWLPTWVQSIVKNGSGQAERGISMMIFAVGGILGGFVSGWFMNRFGIKRLMLWCFGGAFVLSLVLFKLTTGLSLFAYGCMALIALFFGMSQGLLNAYIPQLFPTAVRSTATGICFNISRIFTATVVFFVGWLVNALHGYGNALFAFSFVFLLGFVVVLFQKNMGNGIHQYK